MIVYSVNNNEFYKQVSVKSTIPNDKSTDKCILFFVCYDEVPFEINLNECIFKPVNTLLIEQSIDIIIKQIHHSINNIYTIFRVYASCIRNTFWP
mgnify:CR=1 FL=1